MTTIAEIAAVLPSSRSITWSYATGISNDGTVIGWEAASSGDQGFAVADGVVTILAATSNDAYAISSSDEIVGRLGPDAYGWLAGQGAKLLPSVTGDTLLNSEALAVNDAGMTGGYATHDGGYEAFIISGSTVTWLGALNNAIQKLTIFSQVNGINDSGEAAGWSDYEALGSLPHAFSWQNGIMTDLGTLPGGSESQANAINAAGAIVGWSNSSAIGVHPVEWQNGALADLGIPAGFTDAYAQAINDKGEVVGYAQAGYIKHAILWENGTGLDLNSLLPANSGWVLQNATGINDQGIIVGDGQYNGQDTAFEMTLDGQAAPLTTAQAVLQLFQSGQLATPQTVKDTASNVSASLDGLQTMAAAGDLSSITLSDSTTPTLVMTAQQLVNDAAAIAKIAGGFALQINATSANLDFTAPAGHVTEVHFGNTLHSYQITPLANGGGFTVTGTGIGTDTLSNVSFLTFSGGSEAYSGVAGLITMQSLGLGASVSINGAGNVVGFSGSSSSPTTTSAYFWSQGRLSLLQPLSGAGGAEASHITDSGLISGESYASNSSGIVGSSTAVYWTVSGAGQVNSQPTSIGWLPGDFASLAYAANDSAQIVGSSYSTSTTYHGFLWQNGSMTDLGSLGGSQIQPLAINDRGQVTGKAALANGNFHAFSWQNGLMSDLGTLPGDLTSAAQGINSSGLIVGYASAGESSYQPVYWAQGQIHQLITLPGFTSSFANAVDDRGWIVGEASNSSGSAAVLWANGTVYNLNSLLPSGSAWRLGDAVSVDDQGQITGLGTYDGLSASFELTLPTLLPMTADGAIADQYQGLLSGPTSLIDSALDIVFDLAGLQALANAGELGGIVLTDAGVPNLTVTAAQLTADSVVLDHISTAHSVTVEVSGTAAAHDFSADHWAGANALQFTDQTLIVAATPGTNTVTTGNVTELYGAVFGREPDVGGLSFYQNYLETNPSTPLLQFAEWFLSSSEYSSAHNYAQTAAGDTQFIIDSYKNLLGRTPSSDEVTFYLSKVLEQPGTQLQNHAQMLVYFSASTEFLGDVQVTAQNPASAQHWLILT